MNFDVFISYSHEDWQDAESLCVALDKAGISYWIDRNIHGSANFITEITENIRQCKIVVYIASSSSAKSIYTQKEILYAFKHNKTIVPYKLGHLTFEHNPELDFLFTNIQWVEKLDVVVASVYKLCNNKEYPYKEIQTTSSIITFCKKHRKVLLLCGIMIITTIALLIISNKHQDKSNNHLIIEDEDTVSVTENKESIIDEFRKAPELPVSERVDIVDLIETFIFNVDADTEHQEWRVFSKYTKQNQLIPLSDEMEALRIGDNYVKHKLEFISKLTRNGDNLDSNIYGQSHIQHITIIGWHLGGVHLLCIDSGETYLSYEIDNNWITETLNFQQLFTTNYFGVNYTIYKKANCWLILNEKEYSGGFCYKWYVSDSLDEIFDYIKHIHGDKFLFDDIKRAAEKVPCSICKGKGEVETPDKFIICPTCCGIGWRDSILYTYSP